MAILEAGSFSCCRGAPDSSGRRSTQGHTQGWNEGNAEKAGVSSHDARPRPGRRRRSHKLEGSCPTLPKPLIPKSQVFLFGVLFALSVFCSPARGAKTYGDRQRSTIDRLVQRGELLVDRNPPPIPPRLRLERRQDDEEMASTTGLPSSLLPSTTTAGLGSATDTALTMPTIVTTAPSSSASNLPQPFDTSLGNNFTSPSCPDFIRSFRDNSTFLSCLPLSLLLQVGLMLPSQS